MEKHIAKLQDVAGYIDYYYSIIADYSEFNNPSKQAWEATERIYDRHFDRHKYATYESFKSSLSRYNKTR